MSAPRFTVNGVSLAAYCSHGGGTPVLFQHGLCADAQQTAEIFPETSAFHRITVECRGHGQSEAGDLASLSLATFSTDLEAFIASTRRPIVLGGISMGAALALRIAVRRPDLVSALILARPAWTVEPAPINLAPYAEVGRLLSEHDAMEARARFERSDTARRMAAQAPDNLSSLRGFFSRQPQLVTAALLKSIALDGPGIDWHEVERITVPVLVIGHERDEAHPFAYALELARRIRTATLTRICPKADDRNRYVLDFRSALAAFLKSLDQ